MPIYNITKKHQYRLSIIATSSFISRLIGLLGTTKPYVNKVLYINPCSGIHTLGMHYPIDVIFIDNNNRVSRIFKSLKPFRITKTKKSDKAALEFPPDTLSQISLEIGDLLNIGIDECK